MKLERKDFIKLAGGAAAGAAAGTVFSGAPFLGLQWLVEWTQDQYRPAGGPETFLKTICEACPDKCALSIRMISDRAVKIETSNGGCPIGQNALQLLYHPERINTPLKRVGKKGSAKESVFEKVSWETALKDISAKMSGLVKNGKGAAIAGISKEKNITGDLLERIVSASGSPHSYYEPTLGVLTEAALGGAVEYDFTGADYILSFGARLLEGWGNPSTMNKAFLQWKEKGTRVVQIDAMRTRTASLADQWINIKAGTELFLALGIANYLIHSKGRNAGTAGFGDWSAVVKNYTPEETAKITGVPAARIVEVADALLKARNPIVVAGRGGAAISSSSAELAAVYALNLLVGGKGARLVKSAGLGAPQMSSEAAESYKGAKKAAGLDEFIKNGKFDMLMVNEANPAQKSVFKKELIEKMKNAFVVAVMPLINDTALYADYILPSISHIEEGTLNEKMKLQPVVKAKHAGDALIAIGKSLDFAGANFPWDNYEAAIKDAGKGGAAGTFALNAEVLQKIIKDMNAVLKTGDDFPVHLIPFELPYVGDGDGLAYPYVLKTIDDSVFADGKLFVHISRETAKKIGVCNNERITISSSRGETKTVRARLTDTVAPGAVAIPLGFGQKANTKYAADKGVNPREIMSAEIDPVTGTANWWITRVKIS